jgi:hypothetical protein
VVDTTAVAESSCLSATGARGKTRARTGLLPMDLSPAHQLNCPA